MTSCTCRAGFVYLRIAIAAQRLACRQGKGGRRNGAGRPIVCIHRWLMPCLLAGLLAACGSSSDTASADPQSSSLPGGRSIGTTQPLATANVIVPVLAERVIPLTPTPSPAVVVQIASSGAPSDAPPVASDPATAAPTDAPLLADPTQIAPEATMSVGEDPAALEALLVATINQVRSANGLPPYQHSPELSVAARAHSCDLATHGLISHSSSDGRTLAQRLEGATPPWEWPSESIAAGSADPATIVAWWMDEPPDGWHRRNILDTDQREVGAGYCSVVEDATGNHHYWTADFSRRSPL
jgi:uncharacterized protein YkwD